MYLNLIVFFLAWLEAGFENKMMQENKIIIVIFIIKIFIKLKFVLKAIMCHAVFSIKLIICNHMDCNLEILSGYHRTTA